MHPHLDLLDEIVRTLGWPALLGALVWAIRKYDAGSRQLSEISADAKAAHEGVAEMKANHLVHLQEGMVRLADSNDTAVEVLREINSGIDILKDRFPRA
jgi:predicted chitinase